MMRLIYEMRNQLFNMENHFCGMLGGRETFAGGGTMITLTVMGLILTLVQIAIALRRK